MTDSTRAAVFLSSSAVATVAVYGGAIFFPPAVLLVGIPALTAAIITGRKL